MFGLALITLRMCAIGSDGDKTKRALSVPIPVPVFRMQYLIGSKEGVINVYPTLQFLYSHHIKPDYIDAEVKKLLDIPPAQFAYSARTLGCKKASKRYYDTRIQEK